MALFTLLNDLYGLYTIHFKVDNFLASNIFSLFETLTLYYFFSQVFLKKMAKGFLAILAFSFIVTWLTSFFVFGPKAYYNTSANFENVSILLLSLYYYYEQVITINTPFIYREQRFWIVSAYFISICGTFFLFLYLPTLSTEETRSYYSLNYAFTIIRSILLTVAFIIKPGKDNFDHSFHVRPKKSA